MEPGYTPGSQPAKPISGVKMSISRPRETPPERRLWYALSITGSGAAAFDAAEKSLVPSSVGVATLAAAQPATSVVAPDSARGSRAQGVVIAIVVVAAVSLLAFGILRPKDSVAVDPLQAASGLTGPDMSARVKAQIDAAVKNPTGAPANFNATNITTQTMLAMGLKPGKAQAGCLVGVPH